MFTSSLKLLFLNGDELVEPGNELKPGQIYNSNLYVMADLVRESGSKVITKVIKDDKNALRSFLKEAIEQCDIIISSVEFLWENMTMFGMYLLN